MPSTSMKTITVSTDIARSPQDVFGYISDAARLPDWQPDVRKAAFDEPANLGVGSRGREVRHVMGADRTIAWEITEYDPGHRYGVRGIDGPVRAHVTVELAPAEAGAGTHVEYGIGFEGHGIGKLIAVLARKSARKDLPATLELLKKRLETGSQS